MNAATYQRRMSERTAQMQTTRAGVTIGIQTIPRMRVDMTDDAGRLQAALLSKPRSPEFYIVPLCALAGLAVAVMAVFGWLPGGGA